MRCNAEFYYVGKIPPIGIGLRRRVILQWFYSPRAVGTTLSEVHALYTECLSSYVPVLLARLQQPGFLRSDPSHDLRGTRFAM